MLLVGKDNTNMPDIITPYAYCQARKWFYMTIFNKLEMISISAWAYHGLKSNEKWKCHENSTRHYFYSCNIKSERSTFVRWIS
jgi:hypothetical protein